AKVPASVTIEEGDEEVMFTVETMAVTQDQPVNITALGIGGLQASKPLTVQPLIKTVTLAPDTVCGGDSSVCTLKLNGALPSGDGLDFPVRSDNPAVTVPNSITVPGGADSITFTVKTAVVTQAVQANVIVNNF